MTRRQRKAAPVQSDIGNYTIFPEWVFKACNLYPNADAMRSVYTYLGLRADRTDDSCYPSHKSIAEACGMSVSTAQRALYNLFAFGAIDWDSRAQENGSQTSNRYFVRRINPEPRDAGSVMCDIPPSVMGDRPPRSRVTDKQQPLNKNQSEQQLCPNGQRSGRSARRTRSSEDAMPDRSPVLEEGQSIRPSRRASKRPQPKSGASFCAWHFKKEADLLVLGDMKWNITDNTYTGENNPSCTSIDRLTKHIGEWKRQHGWDDATTIEILDTFIGMVRADKIRRNRAKAPWILLVATIDDVIAWHRQKTSATKSTGGYDLKDLIA